MWVSKFFAWHTLYRNEVILQDFHEWRPDIRMFKEIYAVFGFGVFNVFIPMPISILLAPFWFVYILYTTVKLYWEGDLNH